MKKLLTIFALTSISAAFSQITINANFPSNINIGSPVDADVKINKGAVGNFAKYQLDVPTGYVISAVDAKGGNFTFENQRAKIVWVSVPSEPEFIVKLKVQANSDAVNPGTFAQKFYYLENSEKKEVEAPVVTINIGGATASSSSNSAIESSPVTTQPTETKPVVTTPAESKPVTVNTSPTATNTKPVETTLAKTKPVSTSSSSAAEAGMTFKVQIGAYTVEPSKSKYSAIGKVNIDLINGMYKVTTGNFKSYDEATKFRDDLKSKGYNGFIAKYKDGKRVN